ncbi:MAG TPA: hypothetical protein VH165_11265 [Kofleriaceae bacterium]|nr:hypothetical protein [Kofleriaceae bacterium]
MHADPRWDAGLDLHGTDAAFGSRRPIGIAGGLRQGDVEAGLVVDPLVFALGWETIDVTAGLWLAGDRAELVGGWRQSSGKLGTGRRYDEALLIGADWVVTLSPRYRLAFGAELVTSIYRHGADIGSDPIQLWPLTTDLAERMDLMLHARFEITGWL